VPVITLDEVKTYLSLTVTTYDSLIAAYIPMMPGRLWRLCNNAFTIQPLREQMYSEFYIRDYDYLKRYNRDDDLYILQQVPATFDASSYTVTCRGENFASAGFASGHDLFIRDSYLNDGYFYVGSVSTSALTIASSYSFAGAATRTHSFTNEATGATVFFAVVRWPTEIKPLVAALIQYDIEERPKRMGVQSKRLGPWSETYSESKGEFGYPKELTDPFMPWTVPRYGRYEL